MIHYRRSFLFRSALHFFALVTFVPLLFAASPLKFSIAHPPVGNKPLSVTTADLNGDCKIDIIATNENDKNVVVLLGKGDGTFSLPVSYSLGDLGTSWPVGVTTGDFNGDGKLDVVVVTAANGPNGATAVVLLGNGDGTLGAPLTSIAGNSPVTVATADLNKDHKLDLVVGGNSDAVFMLGNGDGTFQNGQFLPAPLSQLGQEWGVGAVDLNGDGNVDIFTGNWTPTSVGVFLSNGDGTYKPPAIYDLEIGFSNPVGSLSVVSADLNGDNKLDIIGTEYVFGGIGVLIGNGDGTFNTAVTYIGGSNPGQVIVLDLDGDGKLDYAASNYNDTNYNPQPDGFGVTTVLGKGDGTFDDRQGLAQFDTGTQATSIAAGDFNGDGLPDLVTTNSQVNTLSVLINTTTTFSVAAPALSPGAVSAGQSATSTLTFSPLNGFAGTVTLTCAVSPASANAPSCSLSPASVKASGSAVTSTLTVATVGAAAALHPSHPAVRRFVSALWLLPSIALVAMGGSANAKKKKTFLRVFCACLIALALIVMVACGGSSSSGGGGGPSTPAGTYTVQVTATSGALQRQTSLTLTVN